MQSPGVGSTPSEPEQAPEQHADEEGDAPPAEEASPGCDDALLRDRHGGLEILVGGAH